MANIKSIGGNPIVLDASGIAAGAVTSDKLADMDGITAGAADALTGCGDGTAASWLTRTSDADGVVTIRSIHGNTIVQDGELLSVNMEGIETEDADGNPLQTRTIPAGTLRSADSVYDELTATERIVRVGEVDLGTLNWTRINSGDVYIFQAIISAMIQNGRTTDLSCSRYTVMNSSGFGLADKCCARATGSKAVYVRDDAYTDAAAFKAAVSGVMLNYELATPTVTPIDPPLNLTYRTEQGGTERVMVPTGELSAPPTIVTAQGYTAESLRDAALSAIAPVENGIASTNYGVGSYLVHGGQLCKVTTAIATGESITIGTNVTTTTVMAEVLSLTQ